MQCLDLPDEQGGVQSLYVSLVNQQGVKTKTKPEDRRKKQF